MLIYKAVNKISGNVYIGKTKLSLNKRISTHNCSAKKHKNNSYFHKSIRKYGIENFTWEIICETDSLTKIDLIEKFYIAAYRKMFTCYNHADGGQGNWGYKPTDETKKYFSEKFSGEGNPFYNKTHSEETRKRLSEIAKKRKLSDETKKKIGEKAKGHIKSPETLEKMRINGTGRKHTEETKEKMRELKKNYTPWNKGLKGLQTAWNKGKPWSEEIKQKISEQKIINNRRRKNGN